MNTTQQQTAAVFTEWARRYAENSDEFGAILDADGKPVEDYGQRCAIYFGEIAKDMNFPVVVCEGERTAEAIQSATVATALVPHNAKFTERP